LPDRPHQTLDPERQRSHNSPREFAKTVLATLQIPQFVWSKDALGKAVDRWSGKETYMSIRQILMVATLAGVFLVALGGCSSGGSSSSKVTKDNFDKVTTGMTQAQVEDILGKGTEAGGAAATASDSSGPGKVIIWKDGDKSITVKFVNDQVFAKFQVGI
jgi:hypothetical protein